MSDPAVRARWVPGTELARLTRTMTAERMRWYCDALETALAGEVTAAGANIHTDDEFARANGLPARVADGMISTNWLSGVLVELFGDAYLATGTLRTRYVRPVFEDAQVTAVVTVASAEPLGSGVRLGLEVHCEVDDTPCTVGEASVVL